MSINKLIRIAILTLVFIWVSSASALDHPSPFSGGVEEQSKGEKASVAGEEYFGGRLVWGASIGLSLGGDKFESTDLSDVDSNLTDVDLDVRTQAGGRILLGGVIRYDFFDLPLEVRLGFAMQSDGLIPAEDVKFTRFPIDIMAFYKLGKHRIGGGLSFHFTPKLEIEIEDKDDFSEQLDNATGLIFQYDYFILQDASAGVRLVTIDYKGDKGLKVDGNHIAAMVQIYF